MPHSRRTLFSLFALSALLHVLALATTATMVDAAAAGKRIAAP
jgi:hypothetical protein